MVFRRNEMPGNFVESRLWQHAYRRYNLRMMYQAIIPAVNPGKMADVLDEYMATMDPEAFSQTESKQDVQAIIERIAKKNWGSQ